MRVALVLLTFICFKSNGQGSPILMINEQQPGTSFNPTIVVYSDGTIIKNVNEPHELTEYFVSKLDSVELGDFLNLLELDQLKDLEEEYKCTTAYDRNQNSFYYFGATDTIHIEIYGYIRNDAYLLKNPEEFPAAEFLNCLPQGFSKMLGELLYFEIGPEHWIPEFHCTVENGKVRKLRGTKLGEYKRQLNYHLPGEELWIKRTIYNSR